MLSENCVVVGWSWTPGRASRACERSEPWRDLDRQLRSIANRRAALDAEELALIREAVRVQLWRPLAMTSMREYLERRMGYGPQVAAERLRVAEALDALPAIEAALETGELSYSAVRELTRIATGKTDAAWVKACRGKILRQIEELVAEREPGDAPSSDPKPDLRPRRVTLKLRPAEQALLREARKRAEAERGERLDDGELIRALCTRYLDDWPASDAKTSRSRHQVAVTVCRTCKRGWQNGAGREIAIRDADVERAMCDAEVISLEKPGRATRTIPAAIRKAVLARDGHRCTVPGCRATRNLDVHHLEHREHGGTHTKENLTTLCDGHHVAHHDGRLLIKGPAPAIEVIWLAEVPHVGDSEHAEQVRSALRNLGCTREEARRALSRALAQVGDTELEPLLRAALRECPKPIS
jgi:5-methylcytosine-specific restriction endonuclease McrA